MSDKMTIRCNNVPRDILNWWDLSDAERKEYDYMDEEDQQNMQFFRYKGYLCDLSEYMVIDRNIAPHPQREGWEKFEGYASDSFFSGTLIRMVDDRERVIVATYFC